MDRADLSAATVRNGSRMVRRMASGRAKANDIFARFCPYAILAKDTRGGRLLYRRGADPMRLAVTSSSLL